MSSWLNLNESLNTIKGQITTFANNVLAENEGGSEPVTANYEELKKLYGQKEREIETLKKDNEELQKCLRITDSKNGETNDNNWDWTTPELITEESLPKENVSDLKIAIKELENEKRDLINQLEQLDSENQQNLAELVGIREHLQQENSDLKDKCEQLIQQNQVVSSKEERLKKELKELQRKIEETHFFLPSATSSEKYESIVKTNQELHLKLEDTTKEISVLKSTHETLEKIVNDTKKVAEQEIKELTEKLKKTEMENKIIYSEFQTAKNRVKISEQKIQEDTENCQKLAVILETYEKQVSSLKKELEEVKNKSNNDKDSYKNIEILEKSNQELQSQLSKAHERVDILENHNNKSRGDFDETLANLKQESEDLKGQLEEKSKEVAILKQEKETFEKGAKEADNKLKEIGQLKIKIKQMFLEKESMHKMYVSIITDNVKQYVDSAFVPNIQHESPEDPNILEFSKQVEDIFKILLDYKQKCEIFEKEVLQVSQEKTQLLNEKNNEIERLMQNSEILSQDIINKAETIKELETEITNLMTSNDVLMSELDSYKNSGLQTISESNEDNMVLLESDLDNANKRIRELEKIIDRGGQITLSSEPENTYREGKMNAKLEDYQELLSSFDALKIDYDAAENRLSEKSDILSHTETENEDLKVQLEKIKADFENTEYQLTEANFSIDSLTEELEVIKPKLETLLKENKELKLQNMSSIDIKSELNEIREKWLTEENLRRELESQIRGFKEKLQNSKMTETTLKLQYDTLNKEHAVAIESKNNLEQILSGAKQSIAEYENNYTELLQKYDGILLRCEELNTRLHEKENETLKLQNSLKEVEEQKEDLAKIVEEQTLQLQQHIHKEEEISRDLSSMTKLRRQVQEQQHEIEKLTSRLNDEELTKIELKNIIEKQAQEIQKLVKQEFSGKEALSTLEKQLRLAEAEVINLKSSKTESQTQHKGLQTDLDNNIKHFAELPQEKKYFIVNQNLEKNESELLHLEQVISNLQIELKQSQESIVIQQQKLQELASSRNELVSHLTSKNQESLSYYNEIQRLSEILKNETEKYSQLETQLIQASSVSQEIAKKNEEIDKLIDENNFLKEKCDVLAKNLLEEQAKLQQVLAEKAGPSEKELSLSKQLERLQSHLMELEEHYTQELLQAEQKNAELQTKVTSLEEREKNSSNMYTSVSIRANQQVESLQNQLQLLTSQRDELRKKISEAEDGNSKQAAALANLQFVLEQFQKDKEKDVMKETERIRRQINAEKQLQENLRKEIDNLKEQLEESRIGLQAASRLSDQLEIIKKQNIGLKEEVSQLQKKLAKSQETIHNLTSQTDGKIDKSLIKSLVVGLLSSGHTHNWNKDQAQIIKIIATVLDFNQQDHDKVKLNQPQQGSWLGSILFPQPSNQNMSQESLSQAFVKFLENESKPRIVPSLLSEQSGKPSTSNESSKRTTPRASPIVLNEIVLPTFADFGQSRNSSSILKDVLKDNNNS